jgi:hypothetical protein
MVWKDNPDRPMAESELKAAELMMRCGEITGDDLSWLMGITVDREDKLPPRGFKSWAHFDAFKWHQERRGLFGRPVTKRRRKKAA